jgi:hypothetical protein
MLTQHAASVAGMDTSQALADAIFYRDPPLSCTDGDSLSHLCAQCAAGHSQARAYLALSRELKISPVGT